MPRNKRKYPGLALLAAGPPLSAQADFAGFTTQTEPARSHAEWQRSAWYVPARNEVRLAITVYLPKGTRPAGYPAGGARRGQQCTLTPSPRRGEGVKAKDGR